MLKCYVTTTIKYLLYGQHHDRCNDRYTNTGQYTESTSSDKLVGIFESLLEGADGEEGKVLLLLGVAYQIHVH